MVAKKKTAKKAAAPKAAAKKSVAVKEVAAPKRATKRKTTRKSTKKTVVAKTTKAPAQKVGGWWFGSFSGSGLLVAVASLIAVIAFFFGWMHVASHGGASLTFSGLDFLTTEKVVRSEWFNDSWQLMIPLFELVLAILAFIAIIIPAFGVRGGRIGIDAFVVIIGITAFILAICFLFGSCWDGTKFIDHLDVGFYTTIVASVIMILGGLRDATKNY